MFRQLSFDTRQTQRLLTQYYSGDKTEKNEMGGACSAYGREERLIQGFRG